MWGKIRWSRLWRQGNWTRGKVDPKGGWVYANLRWRQVGDAAVRRRVAALERAYFGEVGQGTMGVRMARLEDEIVGERLAGQSMRQRLAVLEEAVEEETAFFDGDE